MSASRELTSPSRQDVWKMFDRIAHRYDFLNRTLSGGIDIWWRKKVRERLPDREGLALLDLATGTGDMLLSLMRDPRVERALGLDLSEGMLAYGKEKVAKSPFADRARLDVGDVMKLEAHQGQYDVATISFGIRNVLDVSEGLKQIGSTLKPQGRALILEFSAPTNAVFRPVYLFYLRNILPQIGGLISGDQSAYRYLNETIETFPSGNDFCDLMRDAGFVNVSATPLTFGIATIYQGDRPDAEAAA